MKVDATWLFMRAEAKAEPVRRSCSSGGEGKTGKGAAVVKEKTETLEGDA